MIGEDRRPKTGGDRRTAAMRVTGVIAVGVVPAGMSLRLARGMNELRRDVNGRIDALARGIAELRERMAHLEGLFEGFTGRKPTDAAR